MSQLIRRPSADRDLVAIFRHYAREANLRVADRFLAAAEATFDRLAGMPGIGTLYDPDEPRYAELRYFPLPRRFAAYLVFFRPIPDGVEIYRVLHGARDIGGILAEELGVEDAGNDSTNE